MPDIEHILCPIDFSEASAMRLDQAVAIAGPSAARISALHVCTTMTMPVPGVPLPADPLSGTEMQRVHDRTAGCFRAATAAGIRVDVLIDVGDPARDILDRAVQLVPFNGFRVPSSVEVAWELPEGAFSYARVRVIALEYA